MVIALFSLIVWKAIRIPITHDEVASIVHYSNFSDWDIMMYPDFWPNNHILNTLAVKYSIGTFGVTPLAARLPNLLAFLIYAGAVGLIAKRFFNSSKIYFLVFVALLCNPYLLDFFGLARGYGLSNAFLLIAVYFCLCYGESKKPAHFLISLAAGLLAAYSNFTLLIFLAALNTVLFIINASSFLQRRPGLRTALVLSCVQLCTLSLFALLCYSPIHKMQSTDQFHYWTSRGFYRETLLSLVENSKYSVRYFGISAASFAMAACIGYFLMLLSAIRIGLKRKSASLSDPFILSVLLLSLTIFVNFIQTHLGTPNLTGRTALSYYPLFITALLFGLRYLENNYKLSVTFTSVFLCALGLYHLAASFNLHSVREWWYDRNTYEVLDYIHDYKTGKPEIQSLRLNTSWWFHPSFYFHIQSRGWNWIELIPQHHEADSLSNTEFYYITGDDYPILRNNYKIVKKFDGGARMLLQRVKDDSNRAF